jgi:hypothetical protein
VLRRLLAADGGSAAGLAWFRGARERCGVVGALALGAVERGDERAEADGESRAEWAAFGSYHRKRRDAFSHGRQHRREVAAAATQQARGTAHRVAAACMACGGREAGGARRSGSWRGQDAALAVGLGARSERRPGMHVQASDRVGRASLRRCGVGPVSK